MAKLTEAQEKERQSWQYRAIEATRGQQSRLGTLLLAVLGKTVDSGLKHPPSFGPSGVITPDSFVLSNFIDRNGTAHVGVVVGSLEDVIDNFRNLADVLKLDDAERVELFAELRMWISADNRPKNLVTTLH